MSAAVTISHLVKQYKNSQIPAVDDISLTVDQGEFFTFLGPNGAGKTTTISILNTTLAKTSGEVHVAGFDLDTHAEQVRRSIGVIFQNPSLDANLTAEENVRFHAMLYGIYPFALSYQLMPKAYKTKVAELADLLHLQDALHKPIKELSGGMKRKLEIIRGLMHQPKVLFLDEPTTGLDPESRRSLWQYLDGVRKEHGTTIFLTTHYLDEAEKADRVCIINHGKIVSLTTPAALKREWLTENLIVDAADNKRTQLTTELKKMKLNVTGEGPFTVALTKQQSAHEILRGLKTNLTQMHLNAPTLEEAYLAVLDETNQAIDAKATTEA